MKREVNTDRVLCSQKPFKLSICSELYSKPKSSTSKVAT